MLGDLLKALFVPSEERITALSNTVTSKFSFIDSIKYAINSLKDIINNLGNTPKISINLGSTQYTSATTVYIDFSWYAPFKTYGDLIITGFAYIFFIWRLFVKLPGFISGTAGTFEYNDGFVQIKGGKK